MGFLNGPISDRLRKMLTNDDPAWSPPRDAKPQVSKDARSKSSGFQTGDPNRGKVHGRGETKRRKGK